MVLKNQFRSGVAKPRSGGVVLHRPSECLVTYQPSPVVSPIAPGSSRSCRAMVAMLWVGGHILLVGTDELGWHGLYDLVHHLEEWAHSAAGALGGFVGWLVETLASAVVGLLVGAVVVLVMSLVARARKRSPESSTAH